MLYNDFLNFLGKYKELQSFRKKIDYANQNLQRIGSGSGRIVYDIDGTKVFKVAKNAKGIAQNEAEANAGRYPDTHDIVTEVFEESDNSEWIISEKAKKVNEARIKQLTEIPSLNDIYLYLRNFHDQNKGKRTMFRQNNDIVEILNENEFVQSLQNFIANYNQSPGDFGRPSTYGEVLRDGQPTIVLTDYGLNDEVYDTHYSPKRKEKYKLYELYNFNDGNDDILSDIGNVSNEVRHGMWAVTPYDVSDGNGVVNEEFISFVSNRDNYPTKPLPSLPYMVEIFHECVNNLKETLNHVNDKKKFYNNLLKLQEYLISQNFYDREPLTKEEYLINEDDANAPIPAVESNTLNNADYAFDLANAFTEKLNLNKPQLKGGGSNGFAFELDDKTIMKLTSDVSEADAGIKTMMQKPKHIAIVFKVYKVVDTEKNFAVFAILQENIQNKPEADFFKYNDIIDEISPSDLGYVKILKLMRKLSHDEMVEIAKHILTDNPDVNISEEDRNNAYTYLIGLIDIQQELYSFNIKSRDYGNPKNLGYKNNTLTFFDVGGYTSVEPDVANDDIIYLPENMEIVSENDEIITESVEREIADKIANSVATKYNYGTPKYVGNGTNGVAYDIGNNMILKVTSDRSEANENIMLIGKPLKHLAEPYKVFSIKPKSGETEHYVIILEKLKTDTAKFKQIKERMDFAFDKIMNLDFAEVVDHYIHGSYNNNVDEEKIKKYMSRNPEDAKYFNGVLEIGKEVKKYSVESTDYVTYSNLGYKPDGSLGFFDIGYGNWFFTADKQPEEIEVDEDGSSKFSTDSDLGQDGFPPYSQGNDTSPSIENDLNANSEINEEFIGYIKFMSQEPAEVYKNPLSLVDFQPDVRGLCDLDGNLFVANNPYYILHSDLAQYLHNNGFNIPREITTSNQGEYIGLQRFESTNNFYLGESFSIHYIREFFNELKEKLIKIKRNNPNLGFVVKSITYAENDDINQNDIVVGLNEDLEYNHVIGDATKDQYELDERVLSSMKGSSTVDVKKNCRLAGKGNTSTPCNQGDINNLNIKPLNEAVKGKRFYRAVEKFGGKTVEFEPEGYYEAIDDEGNPVIKYDTHWVSEKPETAASYSVGGAVMGLYSMFRQHGKAPNAFFIYEINEEPDVDISHWDMGDFAHLQEVRYRRPVRGTYKGRVTITEDLKEKLNAYYEIVSSDEYEQPIYDPEYEKQQRIFQDTDYDQYLADVQNQVHEVVDPKDVNSNKKAIMSVVNGKRKVGLGEINKSLGRAIEKRKLGVYPLRMTSRQTMMVIVFNRIAEKEANRLLEIAKSHGGYLADKSAEEAREIGQLLGYKETSIEEYINKKYGNKIPVMPEKSPDDYDDLAENIQNEGIADTYAEKEFNLQHPNTDFENKYGAEQNKEDIVFNDVIYNGNVIIIKNPKSLSNIFGYVRGIIDNEGNLYCEQKSMIIHYDMLYELDKLGLIKNNNYWDEVLPEDFITVQRFQRTSIFLLGESNSLMYPENKRNEYTSWDRIPSREVATPIYQEFLDKAKRKNPSINFVNEVIQFYKYNDENDPLDAFYGAELNEAQIISLQDLPFRSDIEQLNGKIFSVGGHVRDEFLGKESKDLDILITGIPMDKLEEILSKYGVVNAVGKSFGVLKFKPQGATEDIDIAIPRTETATGEGGHQGFDIKSDHALPIETDLSRRDFTINTIAKDIDGNVIDPYHGQEDLKNKIIRVVNPQAFSDDPLRMLRAVQFASRFGFTIEPLTMKMIQDNASKIKEISPERILIEFEKIIEKGNKLTGAFLLKQTRLLKEIFGKDAGLLMGQNIWENVKTMGEFIWLLSNNLVESPAEFYKTNLKGDINTYKEIKALEMAFDSGEATNSIEGRSVAHNMYLISPASLQSNILPNIIKNSAQELLQGKYPKTVNELAVNGDDLMKLGLQGKAIGEMQKSVLLKIYADKVRNNREELLNLAGQNNNVIKEEKTIDRIEYGCLMLYLDVPVWSKITSVINKNDIYNKEGYGIETEPHLTILYGFHDEVSAEDTFKLFKENMPLKPIDVNITGISIFENPEFDVVKFDVNSEELTKLNTIMRKLPNTCGFPVYHPHITISYVNKGEGKKYVKSFEKERKLKGNELVFSWKGHKGKEGGKTLILSDADKFKNLDEFSYPEFQQQKNTWEVNGEIVDIDFFIEKYDIWNQGGYADPSKESVFEFLQNNYEDFSHDEKLKRELLVALTDRNILDEKIFYA